MVCKNSLLFWNVISKFVCFFKCLLSLGNIPKAENCLTHRGFPWSTGVPGRNTALLPFLPFLLLLHHWTPSTFLLFLLPDLLYPSSFSTISTVSHQSSKEPWGPNPLQITGLGSIVLAPVGGGEVGGQVPWLTLNWTTSRFLCPTSSQSQT